MGSYAAGSDGFEPIAIVGMGCRFPGESYSPSKLWSMLKEGRSGQCDVPKNRYNIDTWHSPAKGRPGSVVGRGGYFLSQDDSYRDFDPMFFGMSPSEAASLDPQQRKMLEVVYESFESAGLSLDEVSGSETACYVGSFSKDFNEMQGDDVELHQPHQTTGAGLTILSNRVNYIFNLKGPSFTVDTACSSSLYALHLACLSLQAGDCTAAVVGGSTIIMSIEKHLGSSSLGVLSPSSTCHTFDASADGFGQGEGVAAIYIKRLSDAIADGNPIRAVIRSTAINSNGRGPGMNHPGQEAQEAVIRKAYARAGLNLDQTGYFECHGTGTPVGDPLECAAIGNVFAEGRTAESPLLIGSVKTNLGHTEGASGLASIIKVVMSLEAAAIPATIGVKNLNPNIDFKDGRLSVVRSFTPWPENLEYRRASVNGFGYGGANAHVILDATESFLKEKSLKLTNGIHHGEVDSKHLLLFSAHDDETLEKNIDAISNVADDFDPLDLAHTLATKRTHFHHRAFAVSGESTIATDLQGSQLSFGAPRDEPPIPAFVFTGQGAQWPQMGYALIQHYPSVRKTMEQLDDSLSKLPLPPDFSIIEVLSQPPETSQIYHSVHSPVCCSAVQIAVIDLLDSWGIRPAATTSHSAGEIAAAYAAGLVTGAEAVAIAYYRGIAVVNCKHLNNGAMMAVGMSAEAVRPYLEGEPDVVIGCYNSPESLTLSGDDDGMTRIQAGLTSQGIFARKVNTSGNAYHSHLVNAAGQEFENLFKACYDEMIASQSRSIHLSKRPMYSCVTGELITGDTIPFSHWRLNLEQPVLFDKSTRMLLASNPAVNTLIEIGPHKALLGPISQITTDLGLTKDDVSYLPSLVRGQDGVKNLLCLAGNLFMMGLPFDLHKVTSIESISADGQRISHRRGKFLLHMPTYNWNYKTLYWKKLRWNDELHFRTHSYHDLLGSLQPGGSRNSQLWRNHLQLANVPWLRDHMIGDEAIFPAAGYIAMAVEALNQVAEDQKILVAGQGFNIKRLVIASAMIVPLDGSIEVLFNMCELLSANQSIKTFDFRISSVTADGHWAEHASGMASLVEPETDIISPKTLSGLNTKQIHGKKWYSTLSDVGVNFGPTFRVLDRVCLAPESTEASATIKLYTTKDLMIDESRYIIHPATLDGCLQLSVMAAHGSIKNATKAFLPVSIDDIKIWSPMETIIDVGSTVYAHGEHHGLRSVRGQAEVFSGDGHRLVQGSVSFLSLEGSLTESRVHNKRQPYTRLVWKPDIDRLLNSMETTSMPTHLVPITPAKPIDRLLLSTSVKPLDMSLADILDLIIHKGRPIRIFQIGDVNASMIDPLKVLRGNTSRPFYTHATVAVLKEQIEPGEDYKRMFDGFKNLDFCEVDVGKDIVQHNLEGATYDLAIYSHTPFFLHEFDQALEFCSSLLRPDGKLILQTDASLGRSPFNLSYSLMKAGFKDTYVDFSTADGLKIMTSQQHAPQLPLISSKDPKSSEPLWLVHFGDPHPVTNEIERLSAINSISTERVPLRAAPDLIPSGARIIMLAELESSLLVKMTDDDLTCIRKIVKIATSMVWITNGGLLDGIDPKKSLAAGLAHTLMTEQPSLQFACYDMDPSSTNLSRSAKCIVEHEILLRSPPDAFDVDGDVIEKDGMTYISRYVPDDTENESFERLGKTEIENSKLQHNMSVDFGRVGQVGSFFFKQTEALRNPSVLQPNQVILDPLAYSLTAKEASILKGQQTSQSFSNECVAIVREVGSEVVALQPGDHVIALCPGKFDTTLTTQEEWCQKLFPHEEAEDIVGLFTPVCTALHILDRVGHVREGKRILIHAPGEVNIVDALIQIKFRRGLHPYITWSSNSEKEYFSKKCGIPEDHLIPANKANWIADIQKYTLHPTVDVVITSSAAKDQQDLWKKLNRDGKYIVIGGSDIPNLALFDTSIFSKGVTLAFVDFQNMLLEKSEDVEGLLKTAMKLCHLGILTPSSQPSVFDVSKLVDAVAAAGDSDKLERVVLNYSQSSLVPTKVTQAPLEFDSTATYLMIGCLGGLGRSLTRWMVTRHARHFIFISRSGTTKPEAAALVKDLEGFSKESNCGITVEVVVGDVSNRADVDRTILAAKSPIRGVIQAAAVFKECLFEDMTLPELHAVLDPKVQGTINLHEALISEPLDFFVMTSSTLGVKAPATQTPYTAANAFLDSFARHRWNLGLQATSIALGMVQEIGHLEENPEIEAALLHTGLQGIDEDEFLVMMELACRQRDLTTDYSLETRNWDPYTAAHIVTGLEMSRMNLAPGNTPWLQDARLRHQGLMMDEQEAKESSASGTDDTVTSTASILLAASVDGGPEAVYTAVRDIILTRFSRLVTIPMEKLQSTKGMDKTLVELGMDSMVSSDMRGLAWREFAVDVPFMKLLEKGLRVRDLVDLVWSKMDAGLKESHI